MSKFWEIIGKLALYALIALAIWYLIWTMGQALNVYKQ